MQKGPILVTGMIRSGTTWLGKMLALHPTIHYIHEPFTYMSKKKDPNNPFFIDLELIDGNVIEKNAYNYIKNRISFRPFHSMIEAINATTWKKSKYSIKSSLETLKKNRPLFKDPTAIFSSNWFKQKFQADVVIIIRHPAAVITSMLNKNWGFDPQPFTRFPIMIEEYFESLRDEISSFNSKDSDIIDQGILFWNMIHHNINKLRIKNEEIIIVTHENLSRNPQSEFRRLFDLLSIPFDDFIQEEIEDHTQSRIPSEFKRDSLKNISEWKNQLSVDQIERIKQGTYENWKIFYSEEDW